MIEIEEDDIDEKIDGISPHVFRERNLSSATGHHQIGEEKRKSPHHHVDDDVKKTPDVQFFFVHRFLSLS